MCLRQRSSRVTCQRRCPDVCDLWPVFTQGAMPVANKERWESAYGIGDMGGVAVGLAGLVGLYIGEPPTRRWPRPMPGDEIVSRPVFNPTRA
jgi:hypothetical protein